MTKNCICFFKQIGLNPIMVQAIHFDERIELFNIFAKFSPQGAEIKAIIKNENAEIIEKRILKKYFSDSLNFNWIDISEQDLENEIIKISDQSEIDAKNAFHLNYFNTTQSIQEELQNIGYKTNKEIFFNIYRANPKIHRSKIALEFNVTRQTINRWINEVKKNIPK